MTQNPAAEILDVFFNGRPAPKPKPERVRICFTHRQIEDLKAGKALNFIAGSVNLKVTLEK